MWHPIVTVQPLHSALLSAFRLPPVIVHLRTSFSFNYLGKGRHHTPIMEIHVAYLLAVPRT